MSYYISTNRSCNSAPVAHGHEEPRTGKHGLSEQHRESPLLFVDDHYANLDTLSRRPHRNAYSVLSAGNAISGEGVIHIQTQLMETCNQCAIAISDNGQGISDTARPRLLDPFYTTKAVGAGTGLSSSLSMGIVAASKSRAMQGKAPSLPVTCRWVNNL